jgi:(R,R)-butanediol dehydrogenase/meso-butanediol dehydrogenase/diacetyl reductase
VLSCGICGTDAEEFRSGPLFIPGAQPHPLTGVAAPVTLGHELCGRVTALGEGVDRRLLGRLVAVDGIIYCGRCRACRAHRVQLCTELASIGFSADGGLAPRTTTGAAGCFPLPADTDPDAGALTETLAVGVRALRRGRLAAGERVAVVGGGPVGLLALQAARRLGAAEVVLVEPRADRRAVGVALGADTALDPASASDLGADLVLECSGAASAIEAAPAATGPGGRIVLVGLSARAVRFDAFDLARWEREVIGSLSHVYDEDFARAVQLIAAGEVATAPVVTAVVPLEAAIGQIEALADGRSAAIKVVVHPGT